MSISAISTAGSFYDPTGATARAGAAAQAAGRPGPGRPGGQLTPDEAAQVRELKARDREVRAHEAAHMAAGAGMTSGASFTYQRGPDGVNYAIGGEVGISTAKGRTPEETIDKARQIRAAALAPADPSGQDRAVAAAATAMEQEARAEMAREESAAAEGTPASSSVTNAYRDDQARVGQRLDIFA